MLVRNGDGKLKVDIGSAIKAGVFIGGLLVYYFTSQAAFETKLNQMGKDLSDKIGSVATLQAVAHQQNTEQDRRIDDHQARLDKHWDLIIELQRHR